MTSDSTEPEYAIDHGWLVEVVNEHTCGTAADGYYGAHEPGCGMVPLARIEDLLKAQADLAALAPDNWPDDGDMSLRAVIGRWSSLYRDAIGVPPSEHQRRRMEEMATHIETLERELRGARLALAAIREVREAQRS